MPLHLSYPPISFSFQVSLFPDETCPSFLASLSPNPVPFCFYSFYALLPFVFTVNSHRHLRVLSSFFPLPIYSYFFSALSFLFHLFLCIVGSLLVVSSVTVSAVSRGKNVYDDARCPSLALTHRRFSAPRFGFRSKKSVRRLRDAYIDILDHKYVFGHMTDALYSVASVKYSVHNSFSLTVDHVCRNAL